MTAFSFCWAVTVPTLVAISAKSTVGIKVGIRLNIASVRSIVSFILSPKKALETLKEIKRFSILHPTVYRDRSRQNRLYLPDLLAAERHR